MFKFILFLKLRWSHNATIFTQEYIEEYYKKSFLFIRDLMLKNVQKQQNCTDIFMFDLLKLLRSELCQFGIVAQVSNMASGPLV